MTNDEVIEELKAASDEVVRHWDISTPELYAEADKRIRALEIAIRALQREEQLKERLEGKDDSDGIKVKYVRQIFEER